MTDDAKLHEITIILSQLCRDLPNGATDIDIKRRIDLAMRIHSLMEHSYNHDYNTVEARSRAVVPTIPIIFPVGV